MKTQTTWTKLTEAMHVVAGQMIERGDASHPAKLQELAEKLQEDAMEVAFCGHFSAGKSTLINRLCGSSLLPSSPIPTSANIVTITYGEQAHAKIAYHDGRQRQVPIDELEAHCKNGDDIVEVTICYPWEGLDRSLVLMDTPGIDSTDEAHHLATTSVMHRADAVFYVMDYNHVQSEINFSFAKKLVERGKPVYLVINMIDKHRESELSFTAYRSSVEEAFAAWGLTPAGFFFLSMKQPEHPYNDYEELVRFLRELPNAADVLKPHNAYRSALTLVEEHGKWVEEQDEPQKARLAEQIAEADTELQLEQRSNLQAQLNKLKAEPDLQVAELKQEMDRIVDNANVIPATTRDLAGPFMESRQPGFKVGWLMTTSKTEAEKERRLTEFLANFTEQVSVHLHTHLVRLLEQAAGSMSLPPASIQEVLASEMPELTADTLIRLVPPGAGTTGEAVLNYSRSLAAEMKQRYRRWALDGIARLVEVYRKQLEPQVGRLQGEIDRLGQELAAYEELQALEQSEREHVERLKEGLVQAGVDASDRFPAPMVRDRKPEQIQGQKLTAKAEVDLSHSTAMTAGLPSEATGADWKQEMASGLTRTSERLLEAVGRIEDIPALQSTARSLKEKAARLQDNQYSLALFGAFSAGKSSFANALLGARALPVSPNPTTAAINKIVPPEEGWEHDTARITMKTAERLEEELLYSLDRLGISARRMEEGLSRIDEIKPGDVSPKGRPHFAFLRAIRQGWDQEKNHLGQELKVDAEQYREYAAVESRSCFVEEIELHLACPMTEAGMTLVDTPGADSINARHTGVAFNYIKNADAILFVTYYNHAFSQADREFLNQLGRVKDSFELDKMFFLVNAADLAASEQELQGVISHVEANLLQHGIRKPRIFPVSSLDALEGKLQHDQQMLVQSGMERFEQQFYHFIYDELSELIVEAAEQDLQRASSSLAMWIEQAQQGEREKEERKAQLREAHQRIKPTLDESPSSHELDGIRREAEELVYYIRQRISIRFGEFFQLAFNPSTLRSDASSMQQELRDAWKELVRIVSYDLSQEMLATSLRMEKILRKMLKGYRQRKIVDVQSELPDYAPTALQDPSVSTPVVDEQLELQAPDGKWLLQQFKNPKSFFEGEGSKKLREQLEPMVLEAVTRYGELHVERFVPHYEAAYAGWVQAVGGQLGEALDEFVQGSLDAFEQHIDLEDLKHRLDELNALRHEPS